MNSIVVTIYMSCDSQTVLYAPNAITTNTGKSASCCLSVQNVVIRLP